MKHLRIDPETKFIQAIEPTFPAEWGSVAAFWWVTVSDAEAATISKAHIRRNRYKIDEDAWTAPEKAKMDNLNRFHALTRDKWSKDTGKAIGTFIETEGRQPTLAEKQQLWRDVENAGIATAQSYVLANMIQDSILQERTLGSDLIDLPEDQWLPEPELPPEIQ